MLFNLKSLLSVEGHSEVERRAEEAREITGRESNVTVRYSG